MSAQGPRGAGVQQRPIGQQGRGAADLDSQPDGSQPDGSQPDGSRGGALGSVMSWIRRGVKNGDGVVEADRSVDDGRSDALGGHAQAQWTGGSLLATRVVTAVLLVAVASGPVSLGVWWLDRAPAAASAPAEKSSAVAQEHLAARDLALAWVEAWLSTPRERADELSVYWPDRVVLPAAPAQVMSLSVAAVEAPQMPATSEPGSSEAGSSEAASAGRPAPTSAIGPERPVASVVSVTVAAVVLEPATTTASAEASPARLSPVRRYLQVAILERAPGLAGADPVVAVAGLPVPVPAPARGEPAAAAYDEDLRPGSAPAVAAAEFVQALVTGQDVSRFVSPGAAVMSMTPAVAASADVGQVATVTPTGTSDLEAPADRDELHVLVPVQLVDSAGQSRSTAYALTLAARDGRWEVLQIDSAPQLDEPDPSTPTSASTEPATNPPATTVPPSSTP